MPDFARYIGIDYSGAETPTSRLSGLRVYLAEPDRPAAEERPAPHRNWTRKGLAEWLELEVRKDQRSLIGIDHGFSFPICYFERYKEIGKGWQAFLADFCQHWPTDQTTVQSVLDGKCGKGKSREGDPDWLRLTERWAHGAKSLFHFGVPGQVAYSTHAGIPWLRYLRCRVGEKLHFWPFDDWKPERHKSVIVEVYPSLWRGRFCPEDRNADQHDAYVVAEWMRQADRNGALPSYFSPTHFTPKLNDDQKSKARVEGWILGVT